MSQVTKPIILDETGQDIVTALGALNSNLGRISAVGVESAPKVGTITLSTTWTGAASPYTQTVTVTGTTVTADSKIDLQPTAAQIASLISDGVQGLVVVNDNGTLTAYAVGDTPSSSMTVQCTVTETA